MNSSTILIKDLSKSFNKGKTLALKNLNLTLASGKMIALSGPDAAGKTTLIRLLAGLLTPSAGSMEIFGLDSSRHQKELNLITGYMPQRFGLYEDLSVQENLDLYARLHNLSKQERQEQFAKLLHFTNLAPFTERMAHNLSGGMKQKLGLACTLLAKPRLLLLDEPSVGVDPVSRRDLWMLVHELINKEMTVLWSTAYLDEAERADEVILLNQGTLLYQGSPRSLTDSMQGRTFHQESSHKRELLREVLEKEEVVDGVIQGNSVRVVLQKDKTLNGFEETPPRLEDAFMDILGGCSKKISPLRKEDTSFVKEPLIEARALCKKFDFFTAVDNVSFTVERGEIFGLLGPNGAGKSTIFKMLCGLLKPTSGQALISGISLQTAPGKARSRIGYMAQKFSLYDNMTVGQNIRFFYGLYPHKNHTVEELVHSLGLQSLEETPVRDLPIGYKQRLALVCAIMHEPDVLFLDEPTSGVDPLTRREFWSHINSLVENGVAIVVTTHFMDEAEYCDRIGLVNEGKLLTIGSPDSLKKSVVSPELKVPTLEDAFVILSQGQRT